MVYRGKLVSKPAALPRLVLRDLIHETVFLGPVVVNDGTVARLINEPNGGLRIEVWTTGIGWTEAPKSLTLSSFMPGVMRPVSADIAARVGMPASELDDITAGEIAIAKHKMSRPRKLYGFLWGTELPTPRRDRAKIVGLDQSAGVGSGLPPVAARPRLAWDRDRSTIE